MQMLEFAEGVDHVRVAGRGKDLSGPAQRLYSSIGAEFARTFPPSMIQIKSNQFNY